MNLSYPLKENVGATHKIIIKDYGTKAQNKGLLPIYIQHKESLPSEREVALLKLFQRHLSKCMMLINQTAV